MCCICFECNRRAQRCCAQECDNCLVCTERTQDYWFEGTEACFQGFCAGCFDCDCSYKNNSRETGEHVGKQVAKTFKNCFGAVNSCFWGCLSCFTSISAILLSLVVFLVFYFTYPIYGPFVINGLKEQYNILMYARIYS